MSDQDKDMFNEDGSPKNTPADPLDLVKREDGSRKYDTYDKLAVGYVNAEKHIKELQAKLDALESGKARTAVEAALEEALKARGQQGEPPKTVEGLKKEDVLGLLDQVEKEKAAKANVNSVRDELVQFAGSEEAAAKLFKERAAAYGVSTSDLTALSARSPALVRDILGLKVQKGAPSKGQSTVTSTALPRSEPERKRVLLGGATTGDIMAEWNACKPQ